MIGIAILGAGDIANTHIEACQQLGDRCRIRGLADVNREKAEELNEKARKLVAAGTEQADQIYGRVLAKLGA